MSNSPALDLTAIHNGRVKALARAQLAGVDLEGAQLADADLSQANLRGAALTGADLRRAILRGQPAGC